MYKLFFRTPYNLFAPLKLDSVLREIEESTKLGRRGQIVGGYRSRSSGSSEAHRLPRGRRVLAAPDRVSKISLGSSVQFGGLFSTNYQTFGFPGFVTNETVMDSLNS